MRIAIGSDHHGLDRKGALIAALEASGHMVLDLGASSTEPVDYPDYARNVGQAVLRDFVEAGVLVCGSGVGAVDRREQDPRSPSRALRGRRGGPRESPAARRECPLPVRASAGRRRGDRGHAHLDRREVFRGRGPRAPDRQARAARGRTGPGTRGAVAGAFAARAAARRRGPPRGGIRRRDIPGSDIHVAPTAPTSRGRRRAPRPRSSPPPRRCGGPARSPSRAMPFEHPVTEETLAFLESHDFLDRFWVKDASLWRGDAEARAQSTGLAHVARRDARPRRRAADVRRRDPAPAVQPRGRPRHGRVVPRRASRVRRRSAPRWDSRISSCWTLPIPPP